MRCYTERVWTPVFPNLPFLGHISYSAMALNSPRDIPQWVDSLVKGHKVTVFSKSYCPFCQAAINALKGMNIGDLHVEHIENNPYCDAIQDYMNEKTGARSVPRVFVNGRFFGGGEATVAAVKSGALRKTLDG